MPEETVVEPKPIIKAALDVDFLQALESFPQLKELPPTEAQIIILYAAGLIPQAIADYMKMSVNTVQTVLNKGELNRVIQRGVEIQKLLLANQIGGIMVSALAEIKKKTKDFKDMPVSQLMTLVQKCHEIQEKVKFRPAQSSDEKSLLGTLSS